MKNFFLKQVVVWLLIFVGVVIFSVFTYIIASNKSSFLTSITTYKTRLLESTGIYVGTKVTIHGTNTGNVIKITLLSDGQVEIWFSVRKRHAFAVTKSSLVQSKNSGALGDRFLNVVTTNLSAPPLKKGSLIPYQESSSLLSILTKSEGELNSIQDTITKINMFLDKVNTQGAFSLLSQENQKDLQQILKSTKNIIQKVESGEGTLGALIYDRLLYNRLLVLLGQRPSKNYMEGLSRRSQKFKKQD